MSTLYMKAYATLVAEHILFWLFTIIFLFFLININNFCKYSLSYNFCT